MAQLICDLLNITEGRKATPCNPTCKYWAFPHLDKACILSDVFSVKQGSLCFEYLKKYKAIKEETIYENTMP